MGNILTKSDETHSGRTLVKDFLTEEEFRQYNKKEKIGEGSFASVFR